MLEGPPSGGRLSHVPVSWESRKGKRYEKEEVRRVPNLSNLGFLTLDLGRRLYPVKWGVKSRYLSLTVFWVGREECPTVPLGLIFSRHFTFHDMFTPTNKNIDFECENQRPRKILQITHPLSFTTSGVPHVNSEIPYRQSFYGKRRDFCFCLFRNPKKKFTILCVLYLNSRMRNNPHVKSSQFM